MLGPTFRPVSCRPRKTVRSLEWSDHFILRGRQMVPELATALHPGVKKDPGADGRHVDQLITYIVACVVSCTVLALLCREWRVYDYCCSSGTTALIIVRWSIFARDSVRHAAGRRHPCKPL